MKKTMKSRKKSVFPKFIKILMAGLMVFGVMQIPGQSINADNVVHAMDAEAKASFDGVTVENGAKISLGDQFATYVGNETLLSDKASTKVAGDTAGIETGSNAVWNSYYSKDRANAMGVLRQNGLPSIAEITQWKNDISSVGAGYWLNDAKTISVDDGSGLTTSTGKKYSFNTRAVAYGDNTMADAKRAISLSGEYLNEADKDNNGAKFDGRSIEIGNYSNISNINLSGFTRKKGYYKDLFAKTDKELNSDLYFGSPSYDPSKGESPTNERAFFLRTNIDYGTLTDDQKLNCLDLYKKVELDENKKPVFDVENRVTLQQESKGYFAPSKVSAYLYDPIEESFSLPVKGITYPQGTLVVYFFVPDTYEIVKSNGSKSILKRFLLEKDKRDTEKISGKKEVGTTKEIYENSGRVTPKYEDFPIDYKDNVYILYAVLPKTLKVFDVMETSSVTVFARNHFTEGLRYYEYDTPIPSTTLTGAINTVRLKMSLDTSKIKFARESGHGNTAPSSNLGAMPTTTLDKDGNYKLVLNNDSLNLDDSPIKKGTKISVSGGTAPMGSVTQNNVITVTPGTTQITIPLVAKGGDKFSAISTKKDGSKAYGVVGSGYDGNVTINIDDLMDTKVGQSKTITLFNEKHTDARYSDEISTKGLEITVKVENPQTIDFTQTTKGLLLDTTFSDKDTFEVTAQVTNNGIEALADTKTPITFTADSSYLVQVGTTEWDETLLIATATFKVVQSQKPDVTDDKFKITINRAGTDTNDPAPQVVSTKVKTLMKTYTISYDLNAPPGETPTNSPDNKLTYTVEDIVTIKPLSLTGYTFSGWTEEVTKDGKTLDGEAGTSNDDKSITINKGSIGDREYTAGWDINKYNITINPNGGTYQGFTTNVIITDVNYKETRTILDPIPQLGKTFKGWLLNDGSDAYFNAADAKELIMGSGNVTLTAYYDDELYVLKLDKNGSTGTQGDITKNLKMGDTETLPDGTGYAKNGFAFNGWNTKADGGGNHYDAGAAFTMPATNKTLYVEWQGRYNIEYVKVFAKSSWIGSEPTEAQKTNRTHFPNEDEWPKLEMKGYTFKGWSKKMTPSSDDDFKENQVHAGDKLTDNIRVYGYLAGNDYKVKFNANGGTGSMAEQTMNFAKNTTLSKNTLSKLGYEFKGWTTQSDGSGTVYNDEQKLVLNLDDYTKEDVQAIEKNGFALYAKWEEQEYTITYDGKTVDELNTINPATESEKRYPAGLPSSYKTDDGISFSNKSPELKGQDFKGWTFAGQSTGVDIVSILPNTIEGNIDFVSIWDISLYSVRFYNEGTLVKRKPVYHNELVDKPSDIPKYPTTDPIESKYKFDDWYERDGLGNFKDIAYQFSNPVKSSLDLYAKFDINKYNVEFKVDTATSITTIKDVEWGTVVNAPIPDTFEKPYYRFTGKWYKDSACTQEFNIKTGLIKEDTVLYAGWAKETYTITYDKNHGDATGSTLSTIIHVGDTDKVYSSSGFLRDGYVFIGWNTERDGTGTSYKEGDTIQTDAPESKTLYAQWVQEAKAFVEIPKTIQLSDGKKDTDDADKAIKTESIKIHLPSDLTMLLPDKDIIIRTKNGFPLTMTSSTSKYDVQVYKTTKQVDPGGGGDTQIDEIYGTPIVPGESPSIPSDALVTLNAKNENKTIGYFTLKTPKDSFKSKGIYTGIMTFYIQYESETQTTESK